MFVRRKFIWGLGGAGVVVLMAGCAGSSAGPSGGTGGGPPTATTTITITSSGVSPKNITVAPGSQVMFINSDSRAHDVASDPHPAHTDCPEINQAGFLNPGQSRQTGNLNTRRTCGFHDHDNPSSTSLQGTIAIQ